MKTQRRRGDVRTQVTIGVCFFLLVGLALTGIVRYSLNVAPGLSKAAVPVITQFYTLSKQRDYAGARQLFSPALQSNISTADLAKRWQKFEKVHGPLSKWRPVAGQAGAVNLFPKSVDFDYLVVGTSDHGTRIFIRVAPHGNGWKIEKLSLFS